VSRSVRLSLASERSNAACREVVPERRRRSIRLRGFDYAQAGAYFITICTRRSACVLGEVVAGSVRLSKAGQVVQDVWEGLPRHYPHVRLDAWTIMPNHVHGIVIFTAEPVGAGLKPAPTNTNQDALDDGGSMPTNANRTRHGLPEIVRAFKTFSARRINAAQGTQGTAFWQRNYYEHVIRNEADPRPHPPIHRRQSGALARRP
jgi:REP element-mobilizing transposase RayT